MGTGIALALKPVRLSGPQAAMKRTIDLAVASLALLLTLPLWPLIAVAIRLDSRGPAFFHQERVTKHGRIFRMHKFRTMRTGDTTLRHDQAVLQVGVRPAADPRRGDPAAVQPRRAAPVVERPHRGHEHRRTPPAARRPGRRQPRAASPRQAVPAGVTGWWQTNGRSRLTPEEALQLDLFYIENWSPSLDLYILLKTFGAVVGRQGAC